MNVLDLFSGIGGFSLGLERAGMRTVAFCEIDPYCRAVLAKHWPDVPVFGDVRELTAARLMVDANGCGRHISCGDEQKTADKYAVVGAHKTHIIDVICGGFPCQDISVAGKGAGITGERSGLWSEYARIIGEVRPRYVIVENVAALLGRGIERVLGDLAALGFDAEWHCISASAVGAPHRRDRVWIVAHTDSHRAVGVRRDGNCTDSEQYPATQVQEWENIQPGVIGSSGEGPYADGAGQQGLCVSSRISEEIARGSRARWWQSEPDVGRMAHGIPFELDLVREIEDGNCNCQETEPEAQVIVWRLLRAMWEHRTAATTSCDLYRRRLYGSVPELPCGNPHSLWHLGPWIEEDEELCRLWQEFYAQPFEKAQDLQSGLLERIGTKKRPQALGSRVDRLRVLGNAIVPQIAEIIGRAIMNAEREEYDADDDITKSFAEAYRVIRERKAKGGPGWTPK